MQNFYITTPIYYVNDKPHIGHAYTTLACDALARFKRMDGFNVKFLSGTDEHGQKVAKSAKKANISPQEFTDNLSQIFKDLIQTMNFTCDDFIRTTESRHKKSATAFWQILADNGFIYKGKYSGYYSIRDEAFYAKDELIEGKAPTGAEVEWTEEETYFFKLSAFQDKLLSFYEENPDFIKPKSRYNEVISFVRGGREYKQGALKDLSISRTSFDWGVKVPNDEKHIIYVWLDALTNYLSAINFPNIENNDYKNFWPADLHVVGKDILRFHAVYWPAFLMAANLPLPKCIFAHGWWTNQGEKISKSVGNVIDPIKLIDEFGLDQIRYFMLSHVIFGNDGDYDADILKAKVNADLANNIGNLAQRVIAMAYKNCKQKIPNNINLSESDKEFIQQGYDLIKILRPKINQLNFTEYCQEIIKFAKKANEYIEKTAPWSLKKTDLDRMHAVLYCCFEIIRIIAIYLKPIIPEAADKLLNMIIANNDQRGFDSLNFAKSLKSGNNIHMPIAVFQKFDIAV